MKIDLQALINAVGIQTTMTLIAACAVAKERWTEADTVEFGTMVRDALGVKENRSEA